jgi:putative DNA primase/helicase
VFQIRQSFYGREDTTLTGKLLKELPSILNWSIDGWRKLKADGCFNQPQSSREAADQLDRMSSDVRSFVSDTCDFQADFVVNKDTLYMCFVGWARRENRKFWPSKEVFCRDLLSAYGAEIRAGKPTIDGERVPVFVGVQVKQGIELMLMQSAKAEQPAKAESTKKNSRDDDQSEIPF